MSSKHYRRDIQALRGIAVLAVVLFHAKESYFPLGYLGVDVFFVISGFVIMPSILQIFTEKSFESGYLFNLIYFYKRRFYRLAPALAVTISLTAIMIFLLGPISDHQKFAKQGIATLLLVGNFGAVKFSGDYFTSNPNPLIHTWSLSVEEQIYIIIPVAMFLTILTHRNLKKNTTMMLVFISVLSFIAFLIPSILHPLYSYAGLESESEFDFYSSLNRVWQFNLGGLGFLLLNRIQSSLGEILRSVNVFSVVTIVILLFGSIHMNIKVSSILASLFAVIVILCKALYVLPNILIDKLEWLGYRSYSIYLVHMPLLYIAKYSALTKIGENQNRIIQSIIAVLASIMLGSLSFTFVENRFRNRHKGENSSIKSFSITVVLTVVIPLVLLFTIKSEYLYKYWGLQNTFSKPTYAAYLDPNCERDSVIGPPCVYSTEGSKKTVLLIGDSHAGHISQAVIDGARNSNWNAVVWAHSGCPVQFQRSMRSEVSDNCININKQMKIWVLNNKPDAIIVSQYIRTSLSQIYLKSALLDIKSIIPNVLLIENIPIFPDQNEYMIDRPLIMSQYTPPKSFLLSDMQNNNKKASNQLSTWARENGFLTLDFSQIFCGTKSCSRFSDKGWLYYDANHLSVTGAKLTIPQIENFLNRF